MTNATTTTVISKISTDRARLGAVRRLVALYRPPSLVFDRLTRLAAGLLETPVALISLVDADRQFFVSSHGLPEAISSARETPLEYSLCAHAVASGRPFVVGDCGQEPSLRGNLAVKELGVAAYAGVPLVTPEGHVVGALCVLDYIPREWTDDRLAILADLAAIVIDELRLDGLTRPTMGVDSPPFAGREPVARSLRAQGRARG